MVVNLENLNIPEDVIENSGKEIEVIGNLTNDNDEIVCLAQFRREIIGGYVCHLSNGYNRRKGPEEAKVVCDIPNFPKLVIHNTDLNIHKDNNGVQYTMYCISDAYSVEQFDRYWDDPNGLLELPMRYNTPCRANWLW